MQGTMKVHIIAYIWPFNSTFSSYTLPCVCVVMNRIYSFTVPLPTLSIPVPSPQTVGQSLTLTCSATTVRGITSRVDIIWSRDCEVLMRTNNISPTMMGSSLVFTVNYIIPQLCLYSFDQDVYQCEVVINTSPLVMVNDSVTLGKCTTL